jgi:hypothetical protein
VIPAKTKTARKGTDLMFLANSRHFKAVAIWGGNLVAAAAS